MSLQAFGIIPFVKSSKRERFSEVAAPIDRNAILRLL
jgi:hypothetical protein